MKKIFLALMLMGITGQAMDNGLNALCEAARRGDLARCEQVLELGADVNARDGFDKTALLYAKTPSVVDFLLRRGADVTGCFNRVMQQNDEFILLLLKCGVDINAQDDDGKTALMHAIDEPFAPVGIITTLLKNQDINLAVEDNQGYNAFLHAAGSYKTGIVLDLLEKGADINSQDPDHNTALIYAAGSPGSQLFRWLLSKGADVNIKNNEGQTALMVAIQSGFAGHQIEDLIINRDADVTAQDNAGKTVLTYARERNDLYIINKIEEAIAKKNEPKNKVKIPS